MERARRESSQFKVWVTEFYNYKFCDEASERLAYVHKAAKACGLCVKSLDLALGEYAQQSKTELLIGEPSEEFWQERRIELEVCYAGRD